MTNSETTSRVLEIAKEIQLAIQDVPLAATGPEIADALQIIALSAAEQVVNRVEIARTLMTLAERYLASDQEERGKPEGQNEAAHGAFTAAVSVLVGKGLSTDEIRQMMLGYAVSWVSKADGPREGAGILYRHADALVGHIPTHH